MRDITLATLTLLAPLTAQRADQDVVAGERGEAIARFLDRTPAVGFCGAVLVARDGEVIVARGVGPADAENGVPNTSTTLFEIASASKQFTAAAVLMLEQQGELRLDDPVGEHLPGVPQSCDAITIRHLLQHTSGIPGSNSRGGGDDLAAVLPTFLEGGPRHEPGTHWEYWNQGYALLSEIVARASGRSFVEFSREELFEPLRMKSTCFTGDAAPKGAVVARGASARGPSRTALEHPYGSFGFQYRGMGGVVTNVHDLWRWDRALHRGRPLRARALAAFFEPGPNDYALGWFVRTNDAGRLVQSHGGGVRAFVCEVRRLPEQDAAVFVLANRDDAPVHRIADAVEALAFDEPLPFPEPPAPLGEERSEPLEGTWVSEDGRTLTITSDGVATRARLEWGGGEGAPVTQAVLGLDEEDRLVLFDWSKSHDVRAEDGSLHVVGITFGRDGE